MFMMFRFTAEQHDALLAPVGRLMFAGEAYLRENREFAYLQTAAASGSLAASTACRCLNLDPDSQAFRACTEFTPAWERVHGCMYEAAENYNEDAEVDDGSCSFAQTSDAVGMQAGTVAGVAALLVMLLKN